MSTRQIITGPRADGTIGIFVSPPGVDAFTAPDSSLLLNISSKLSQLIMQSSVPSDALIPLGLSSQPIVLVTSYNNLSGVPGHTWGAGPVRPSPLLGFSPSYVAINAGGASMTVIAPVKTVYSVFSKTF
jgi:hypothetical protein